jgi:hypothetical protein
MLSNNTRVFGNSRENEMETRKLVLGFCALAAVTGAAPKAFGDVEVVMLRENMVHWFAEAMKSRKRELPTDAASLAIGERLKAETEKFADLFREEISCVERAFWYEHRAFFLHWLAVKELNDACRRTSDLQNELIVAREYAAEAKIKKLELEFAEALEHKERVLQKGRLDREAVAACIKAAQTLRELAPVWRAKRLAYLVELNNAERERLVEQRYEFVSVETFSSEKNIPELEKIRTKAFQDTAVVQEMAFRKTLEEMFTACISDVLSHHTGDNGLSYAIGDDLDWRREIQSKYHQKEIGYDYDFDPFERQLVLLRYSSRHCELFEKVTKAIRKAESPDDTVVALPPVSEPKRVGLVRKRVVRKMPQPAAKNAKSDVVSSDLNATVTMTIEPALANDPVD